MTEEGIKAQLPPSLPPNQSMLHTPTHILLGAFSVGSMVCSLCRARGRLGPSPAAAAAAPSVFLGALPDFLGSEDRPALEVRPGAQGDRKGVILGHSSSNQDL